MDYDENNVVLKSDWTLVEPIKIHDICILESRMQEFMCFDIIRYGQYQYLYFGSFDFENTMYAVQVEVDGKNYAKVLSEKPQQQFAFNLYKRKIPHEL